MIDKYKSCEGCPDRSIFPNCHSTCEGYISRCKNREMMLKKEEAKRDIIKYETERAYKLQRKKRRR